MSLSAHQSARMGTDEWLTPPEILAPLGEFDLDPCSPVVRPWNTALRHYSRDGLSEPWAGRVWLNPPFGTEAVKWLRKLMQHGNGIALLPARTETRMYYECVWGIADAVCFLRGRPHFHYVTGERAKANSGAPIALIAYGQHNADVLRNSGLGFTVKSGGGTRGAGACVGDVAMRSPDKGCAAANAPTAMGNTAGQSGPLTFDGAAP